jgi:hypothetical protein
MKKTAYIIIAACVALTACDVERFPHNGYRKEQLEVDPAAFELLLTGVYGQMKGMADNSHRAGEYPGDNVAKDKNSTDAFAPYISYLHIPSNYRSQNIWDQSYKVISQTSELMKMVDEQNISGNLKYMLGEAYYMRGLAYFYLCRVFGKPYYQSPETNLAVPIINGKPDDPLAKVELPDRATVKQVYEQIIADLKKGETLMTDGLENVTPEFVSSRTSKNIYASAGAAQAMLSRVYLYMSGSYDSPNNTYSDLAIEYANKVIESGKFAMLPRDEFKLYNSTLPENNRETIFAIKRTDADMSPSYGYYYSFGGMYSNAGGQGWNEMYASTKYMDRLRHSGNDNVNVIGANAADARGSFIHPYYTGQSRLETEAGVAPTSGTDYFYAVVDSYATNGTLTNFVWLQLEVEGTDAVIKSDHDNDPQTPPVVTTRYALTPDNGRFKINYKPANAPAAADYVGDIYKSITSSSGNFKFSIFKCSLEDGNKQLHSPVVSRLAEMYLNRAEAYVKKGDYSSALENINVIRNRAVLGNPITLAQITANGPAVVDNERTLELAWEAHRGFDAFRTGLSMTRRYPGWMGAADGVNNNLVTIPATHENVIQLIDQTTLTSYEQYGGMTPNTAASLPAPDLTPYTPFIPY